MSPSPRLDSFARLVEEKSGIRYQATRRELLGARLKKRMGQLKEGSLSTYWHRLEEDPAELDDLLDLATTNQTYFFREEAHFRSLAALLQSRAGQSGPIRLWSAACSSGEEPYSMAITALETLGEAGAARVKILASDLSRKVLGQAASGAYDERRIESLGPQRRMRHFKSHDGLWLASPSLRAMVFFSRLNLMELPVRPRDLDAIFCRNVMIYFGRDTQQLVVDALCERLRPGGLLFTGMSENLLALQHGLKNLAPSVYQKPL